MSVPAIQNNRNYSNTKIYNNWATIAAQTTSSVMNQMMVVNSTSTTNSGIYINDSASVIVLDEGLTPANLDKRMRGDGLDLGDGKKLVYRDDNLVLVETHADGIVHHTFVPKKHKGIIDLQQGFMDVDRDTILRLPDGSILHLDKLGKITHETYINVEDRVIDVLGGNTTLYESLAFCHFGDIHIAKGHNTKAKFILPNDVEIILHPDDSVEVNEGNGKQMYRSAPVRDFNKYLNASDLLEEFIAYCAKQRLTRKDFAEIPVSLFIYWLIVQAAEADGDPTDEVLPLLTTAVKEKVLHSHRCKCCGKYLSKRYEDNGINFCSTEHMSQFMERKEIE